MNPPIRYGAVSKWRAFVVCRLAEGLMKEPIQVLILEIHFLKHIERTKVLLRPIDMAAMEAVILLELQIIQGG